jgi:hypothetical protein
MLPPPETMEYVYPGVPPAALNVIELLIPRWMEDGSIWRAGVPDKIVTDASLV